MKGIVNVIFFVVALQSACFLCTTFGVGVLTDTMLGSVTDVNSLSNYFSFDRLGFTALLGFGGGAVAAGIVGILTRSGTYALYALTIFALGSFIPFVQTFVLAFPNTVLALVQATGAGPDITGPILTTFGVWVALWAALYLFGILFNREIA